MSENKVPAFIDLIDPESHQIRDAPNCEARFGLIA